MHFHSSGTGMNFGNDELVTVRLYDIKIAKQFSRLAGELLLAVELFCDEDMTDESVLECARDMRAFCDEHWMAEECL